MAKHFHKKLFTYFFMRFKLILCYKGIKTIQTKKSLWSNDVIPLHFQAGLLLQDTANLFHRESLAV